ncbi:MAG: hypothetical protein VKI81_02760 [Synechococcaceae cyanobacterium]|nr:hypothetical protein [Synechococcaceae cyanobacterium]
MGGSPDPVAVLLAALASITQPPPRLEELEQRLRSHPEQITLRDLGLDSLGMMEFCISLELDHATFLTPEVLGGMHSADQILRVLGRRPAG